MYVYISNFPGFICDNLETVLFKNYPTYLGADNNRKRFYTFLTLPLI